MEEKEVRAKMGVEELGRKVIFSIKPYVPGKPVEEVQRELGIVDVVKLASNENPLGPSPQAIEAMKEALNRVNCYPDSNCYYLKKDLALHLGCSEDNLIFGNGSDELLKLIAEAFLNPGEEVIVGKPTFSEYEFVAKVMDAKTVEVPLKDDFTFDLEGMLRKVNARTKVIFLCNPNNPTGTIITSQELLEFIDRLPDDVIVVLDEAYYEYVTDPLYPDSLELVKKGKNVIVLRTFSKIYGLAGLRIGYGIAKPEIISMIHRVREPFNVNLLAQEAARASIKDKNHLMNSKKLVEMGREYLYKAFDRLGLKYIPTQTNFIFLDVKCDSVALFNSLLKKGVIVRTGDIFGYPTYIRVTIGTQEQNERFIKCLEMSLDEVRS
ncbi:MAG: histidinol-phosphate transaminase [Thermacetogeniaceae bacterium]